MMIGNRETVTRTEAMIGDRETGLDTQKMKVRDRETDLEDEDWRQ